MFEIWNWLISICNDRSNIIHCWNSSVVHGGSFWNKLTEPNFSWNRFKIVGSCRDILISWYVSCTTQLSHRSILIFRAELYSKNKAAVCRVPLHIVPPPICENMLIQILIQKSFWANFECMFRENLFYFLTFMVFLMFPSKNANFALELVYLIFFEAWNDFFYF